MSFESGFSLPMLNWYPADLEVAPADTQEVQLAHVTSDAMDGFLDMKITVNSDHDIVGFSYVTHKNEKASFKLDQFAAGFVLYRSAGRDVAKLASRDFQASKGGHLELIYLYNGITGSTEKFSMELVRVGNEWKLEVNDNAGRRYFTSMFLKGNFLFGRAIGIESVSVK